jgi:hypothetical protein
MTPSHALPRCCRAKVYHSQKPRPDFPLFPHATGRWAEKVRQRFVYFGNVVDDPDGQKVLDLWMSQRDNLLADRQPRMPIGSLSVAGLCNKFLTAKRLRVNAGEMSARSWGDYYSTCESIVAELGRNSSV